jgi:hypothetical protein
MTLDQRAHAAAAAVQDRLADLEVPDVREVISRVRRRRRVAVVVTAAFGAALVSTTAVLATHDDGRRRVDVVAPDSPAGTATKGRWSMVPKATAGIGVDAALDAVASDATTALVSGTLPNVGVVIWRTDDGLRWTRTEHPSAKVGGVRAIAMHDGAALAIGGGGVSAEAFVWRSDDGGRHWRQVAHGNALFGAPVPNSRPVAFVSGLLWRDGYWIAYGGAASGGEGIWISRDGRQWNLVLDSRSTGSIDGILDTADRGLMAYGAGYAWFTDDPTSWGDRVPLATPADTILGPVAAGAALGFAQRIDVHGQPTPLVRSADGGRTWRKDDSFLNSFPGAWVWNITRVGDRIIAVGVDNRPAAFVSTGLDTWEPLPATFERPTLPRTSIATLPPGGALTLVAVVADRAVMLGTAPELDRFFVYRL